MLRWTVFVLLTVNVCYLLWSMVSPDPRDRAVEPWPEGVPALEILTGEAVPREPDTGSGLVAAPVLPESSCWRIGPFAEPEQREAFVDSRLADIAVAVFEEEQVREGDWRVFLPPAPNREAALALRESLQSAAREAGASLESFVMTDGPRQNGVSLGLFSQEANARGLAAEVEALGLEVAVEREAVSLPVEWLEVMVLDSWMDEARRSGLASYSAELQVTENLCQTIAPQPYFP